VDQVGREYFENPPLDKRFPDDIELQVLQVPPGISQVLHNKDPCAFHEFGNELGQGHSGIGISQCIWNQVENSFHICCILINS